MRARLETMREPVTIRWVTSSRVATGSTPTPATISRTRKASSDLNERQSGTGRAASFAVARILFVELDLTAPSVTDIEGGRRAADEQAYLHGSRRLAGSHQRGRSANAGTERRCGDRHSAHAARA